MKQLIAYIVGLIYLLGGGSLYATNSPKMGKPKASADVITLIHKALEAKEAYMAHEKLRKYDFPSLNIEFEEEDFTNEEEDNLDDIYRSVKEYYRNEKVKNAISAIERLGENNLIEKLTASDLVKLPLGIVKNVGGTTYSLVFDQAKIYPDYAEVRVYGRIKNSEVDLCFGSENIKLSYEGGIIGDATLALLGDFAVPVKSEKIGILFNRFQSSTSGGTYMTFDCDGFVEAGIDADVILSRDWVLPVNQQGKVIEGNQRVRTNLQVVVSDFNDMVASTTLPHFTMTRDTSVAVFVDRATFDFSETKNAPGFIHPKVYNFETGSFDAPPQAEDAPLWKGFYMEQMEILLPHVFKTSNNQPLIVGARNLYIDTKGVSGELFADGVLPLETGSIGESGWAFAIDHVGIELNYNRIYGFDFQGRMNIPITSEEHNLNYEAWGIPAENHYNFAIGLDSTMTFPVFKAGQVRLNKGTSIGVEVVNNDFRPNAILCGGTYISINGEEDEADEVALEMPGVEFHKILVRDTLPYVALDPYGGSISLIIPPILNASPITIDHLSLTNAGPNRVKLGFGVEVNVSGSEAGGGKTGGAFGIIGEYRQVGSKMRWQYAGIEVDAMSVEIVMGTYLWISGGLEFYEGDEVWGNGFYGYLEGGIMAQGDVKGTTIGPANDYKVRMQASARFGTKFQGTEEEFKYWAYDFYVSSNDKLFDIYPPIIAKGIGGGVYHHMTMASYDLEQMAQGAGQNPYSGISYMPDAATLFGIKFSLGVGIDAVDGFRGNLTLELAIDQNYALQNIMLYGNGEFASDKFKIDALSRMGELKKTKEESNQDNITYAQNNNQNKILAAVMLYMDFENGFELQGNFGAYLNAANGMVVGEAVVDMYLSEDRKHMYIGGYEGTTNFKGKALEEAFVKLNFNGFSVMTTFYLCTGNDLPPPPGIPAQIAEAFGISPNTNNRASLPQGGNDLANGFAFGASLKINFNLVKASVIKFHFNLLTGFDINLLSNPSNSYCSAWQQGEHGINGWRAKGQVYGDFVTKMSFWLPKFWKPWQGKWVDLFNVDVKVLMTADVPAPSSFFIAYKYNGLFGPKERTYEYGEPCGTVVLN